MSPLEKKKKEGRKKEEDKEITSFYSLYYERENTQLIIRNI